MLFYRRVTRHRGVFSTFFTASSSFRVTRHKFSALETCFNAYTRSKCWRSNSTLPTSGHGGQTFNSHPAVLAVKLSSPPSGHGGQTLPFHTAVMEVKLFPPTHRSWRSTSPLPPSGHGSQTLPLHKRSWRSNSPLSAHGHPPPLLVAILIPPHLAVMAVKLSPPTQRSWRSNSPLITSGHGGQTLSSHPAVTAVKPSPPT